LEILIERLFFSKMSECLHYKICRDFEGIGVIKQMFFEHPYLKFKQLKFNVLESPFLGGFMCTLLRSLTCPGEIQKLSQNKTPLA